VRLRSFCYFFREEEQRFRTLFAVPRDQRGLAIMLATAIIASPHYHESASWHAQDYQEFAARANPFVRCEAPWAHLSAMEEVSGRFFF